MSHSEKCALLDSLMAIVDGSGAVGKWANDARKIIQEARSAIGDNDAFQTAMKNWKRNLMQAPPYVYDTHVRNSM